MLEILFLIALTGRIGRRLEGKGCASGWYKLLAVELWFGGEILGMIFGLLLSVGSQTFGYIMALVCAAISVMIADQIVQQVEPATLEPTPKQPRNRTGILRNNIDMGDYRQCGNRQDGHPCASVCRQPLERLWSIHDAQGEAQRTAFISLFVCLMVDRSTCRLILRWRTRSIIMSYTPSPIDTTNVILPDDIMALTEQLARNTHDLWAQQRLVEGCRYGPQRDDIRKEHPAWFRSRRFRRPRRSTIATPPC
jgi:hypothetical protein